MNSILSDQSEYSRKASRAHIPYLIISLLFQLRKANKQKASDLINELSNYSSPKMATSNANYRTNTFIKLLKCIPEGYFNSIAIRRRSKKLEARLKNTKLRISDEKTILELIPYDHLWEMILEDLTPKNKKVSMKKRALSNSE